MFSDVQLGISHGSTMAVILEKHQNLIPAIALKLVTVGEETGTLGEMLMYLAEFYEAEIEDETKNLTSLIEPVMIILIGLSVGWLAISILMPIYKVVGSI
jgi:type IV pilus assembly protein PilC